MTDKKDLQNVSTIDQPESKVENPLSLKNIVAGVIVTVLGGVILAYIIQDARFSVNQAESVSTPLSVPMSIRDHSIVSTLAPNSTRVTNSSTVIVTIDEEKTLAIFNEEIFISVNFINNFYNTIRATIGAPGCVNQEIKDVPIGYAVIYECNEKYDIRVGSIKSQDSFLTVTFSVEFYVTKLEK
jgi:hypothetical protein